nr:IS4 family transposase [Proteiniphilum sp. UBA5384]
MTRSNLSKANERRDPKIFEDFAYYMINIARRKRIVREFEIEGKVYAFDSTTIDLCLSVFWWAKFRKTKAGIKLHTLFDIETQIPAFVHVTPAKVHDMNAMDIIPYETGAYYVFDIGYFDLKRLNHITQIESYFVVREKSRLQYEVIKDQYTNHNADGILADQIIKLTGYASSRKYPPIKLPCFIITGGMLSCSLNGSSSILKLNPFGVQPRGLFESKYLQLSLHIVW